MRDQKPKLSVVVPTLNEEQHIAELISRLSRSLSGSTSAYELIIIDDHSADATQRQVEKYKNGLPVGLFEKRGRAGKSYSILEGATRAKYELIAMIDADLQYPPEAIPLMIDELVRERAGLVLARRRPRDLRGLRAVCTKALVSWFSLLVGPKIDVQSGLKLFNKDLLSSINPDKIGPWTLDMELVYQSLMSGQSIASVEVRFSPRRSGRSKVRLLADGPAIFFYVLKIKARLLYRRRRLSTRFGSAVESSVRPKV